MNNKLSIMVIFGLGLWAGNVHAYDCTALVEWDSASIYNDGDVVQHDGEAYEANWWTQGQDPSTHSGQWQEWTELGSCNTGGGSSSGGSSGGEFVGSFISGEELSCEGTDGRLETTYPGFDWDGYVNPDNRTGSAIQMGYASFTGGPGGNGGHRVTIRYANGSDVNRPMTLLDFNDVVVEEIPFPPTGSWSSWRKVSYSADIGHETWMTLVSKSDDGGPNVDWVKPEYSIDCGSPSGCGWSAGSHCRPGPVNKPPVAEATIPAGATMGSVVSFTGDSSSDPDGSVVGYEWRFGDDNTSTEANPDHSYSSKGNMIVRLTVTDDLGETDRVSDTIYISSMPDPNCWAPGYVAGTAYQKGDIVQNEGDDFRCLDQDNCSSVYGTSYAPGAGSRWQEVWELLGACAAEPPTGPCATTPDYIDGTDYAVGDMVKNEGALYRCDVAGWCSTGGWAYTPGTGTYWAHAWTETDRCP